MAYRTDITAEFARQLLDYNPDTGMLVWKQRTPLMFTTRRETTCKIWNTRFAGKEAGGPTPKGYRIVSIYGVRYKAHRIIWLIVYGVWPKDQIDHRTGDRGFNAITKLREATAFENRQNQKRRVDNSSGYTGVSWHSAGQKWSAYINAKNRRLYLGLFKSKEDAIAARLLAKRHHHPFQPTPRES